MDILEASQKLNNNYLKAKKVIGFSKNDFTNKMKKDFNDLFESMESVFKISLSDSYDYNRLKYMFLMSNKIKNNEITEHDASVEVGQVLVDKIVKPQIEKQ